MKQHYLFATAAIFVTQLAIAQANKTETKKDHPSRPARTEQTLKVDRSVSEKQPTRETQKPTIRQPQTNNSGNTRKVEDRRTSENTFSMNSPKDDKTRETKKDFTTRVPNNNGNRSPQRNDVITNDRKKNNSDNRNFDQSRNNNYDQSRFGNTGRYNRIDRNYYPDYRRPYSFIGVRYTNFYRPRYIVPYRGMNYYYSGGFFYQPYQNYFQVIIAPVGIRTFGLPWGYRKWNIGPSLYYYYGGTYYRNVNNYYEVVEAPLGSILPELPNSATSVVINNQQYFQLNGTYYKETIRNGETWYTVVGKNGQLSTTTETLNEVNVLVGDIVTELPDNTKTVILNNQKYFVSENDVYYQEVIAENSLYYKVIAKPQ
jgi:hypothetical protein